MSAAPTGANPQLMRARMSAECIGTNPLLIFSRDGPLVLLWSNRSEYTHTHSFLIALSLARSLSPLSLLSSPLSSFCVRTHRSTHANVASSLSHYFSLPPLHPSLSLLSRSRSLSPSLSPQIFACHCLFMSICVCACIKTCRRTRAFT